MKKLLLILLCLPMIGFGQFPGEDVDLLLNKELKLLPKHEDLHKYGYRDFFKNNKMEKVYACCESYNSKYKSLVDKVFIVTNIEPYKYGDYKLELKNDETGIIYYRYKPRFKHSFPFEILGGLTYPSGFFCKGISKEVDKFTDKITYRSPILEAIHFTKIIQNKDTIYYLRCNTLGSTVVTDGKGVILLLDNSDKIQWPDEKIDVRVNQDANYEYSCFVRLNNEDIEKLQKNNITDFRLYVFDRKIEHPKKYKEYMKCIVKQSE